MPLIDLKAIHKQYEARKILSGADFAIEALERVGIVGKNGSGKSTFMKIAAGFLEPDSGKRLSQNNITTEMLDQNPKIDESLSVKAAIEQTLSHINEIKFEYKKIVNKLEQNPNEKELINLLSTLGNQLDFYDAWNIENKVDRILKEFDLKRLENNIIYSLSGGEKRRVALGSILLKKPDLLLLDEPTNHLDVYMTRFLEEILLESKATILFISHDRYFIERIATRTIEIEDAQVRSFNGGYNLYLEQKAALLENMIKSHETLVKELRSEQEWLNRGVKARLKRNLGRVERIKKMKEEAKKNPSAIRKIKLELDREKKAFNQEDGVNKKKVFFEIENARIAIENNVLIDNFTAKIIQQDKIAIVGKNGSGKTTLLLSLLGRISPKKGNVFAKIDSIGYFDQDRSILDDSKNLIETFCPNGGDHILVRDSNIHIYGYMKSWLFPKEFLDKKISALSGGEKNRVALALLLAKKYDCLILDEPTNDLDIPTINILEEYLKSYQGALIFVSHDRYFIDKIAKKLWVIKDKIITEELCSYSEYLDDENFINEINVFEGEISQNVKTSAQNRVKPQSPKFSYLEQKQYDSLPQEIEKLENEIKELNEKVNSGKLGYNELVENHDKLEALKQLLDEKINVYILLEEKREQNG
ncbi:MAG: ABC-F family ATP-binding cassette domain-containing protein [Helicobacteraceae bacterium]|nr:ABC-F family ATP-binding cassette domain-containing protein [Helicobacteraceae bacterium]